MELFDYEREHLQALSPNLAECTVLLRKDGSFPLAGPCRIAAYGNGVRNTIKGGIGSGDVNSRFYVTVEQGLEDAGFEITTKSWLDQYDIEYEKAHKRYITDVKRQAKKAHKMAVMYAMGMVMVEPEHEIPLTFDADACVYVLARNSGEGNDRRPEKGDILLTDSETREILELSSRYDRFMLVLNTGGPVDLSPLKDIQNILVLSQLGVGTGSTLADILLGRQNPSGKLSTTWSAWEDYCSEGGFGDQNDSDYREGIYVGYRYFDSIGKTALFPFGYGLSYTSFNLEPQPVEREGSKVTVTVNVRNSGKFAGKEVVQVYVSCPQVKLDKSYQDLAGFAKTVLLEPGESTEVRIEFDLRSLCSYDEERSAYILEAGPYVVRVGNSSVQTVAIAVLKLSEEVLVRQAKACCGKVKFKDFKPECDKMDLVADYVPTLAISADSIRADEVCYKSSYDIDDEDRKLTDRELVLVGTGAFNEKGGLASVIGSAGKAVPGSAGETVNSLVDKGFKAIVMADGPAGLRLTRSYYKDSKGTHALESGNLFGDLLDFLPGIIRGLAKKLTGGSKKAPKGAEVLYQCCTAIPIGTAIAQSWDTQFARLCGDIVGDEMQRFGVHLWLAPALNIHRSIRCGRNFEYFSEDPLISGRMAAALTLGVQAHEGCATTIKHYAANNQETNRYGNSSNISERALREIYLRGFEICIRESQPKALMTSYNLINGEHTAQSRDLIENILRREFGFEGLVMTDWVVNDGMMNSKDDIYPKVRQDLVAAAGGDLFMPGCAKDVENTLKGLAEGTVSREQLEINATRVLRLSKALVR